MSAPTTFSEIKQITKSDRYLLLVLCYINVIVYMDRIGIAAVLVDIQKYFSINDSQGGLLQTVLLLTYTFAAPIFGYFGDRYSRKWLIMTCIVIWSMSTVFGALSDRYDFLLISRALIGIGQSGFVTIAPTLISDVVVRGARSILLACFYFGIPIGSGTGYITTSFVSKLTGKWAYGLCVGPILNILGLIFLYFVTVPKRGEKEAAELGAKPIENITSIKEDILYLKSIPTFNLIVGGFTAVCFIVGALSWWMPKVLFYGFKLGNIDMSITEISFYFGLLAITTGLFGVMTGLFLSRCLRKRFPYVDPIICGAGLLIAFPIALSGLPIISISPVLTFILIFFYELCINLNWAITTDTLLYVILPARRTTAQGFGMLITHMFGDCISPYIIGFLSDILKKNLEFTNGYFFLPAKIKKANMNLDSQEFHALQMSLFAVSFILVLGACLYFMASRYVVTDSEKVKKGILENTV